MSTQCLFCASNDQHLVVSLGAQPLANSYLAEDDLRKPEPRYPLDLYVCRECFLAHIEVVATSADIFSDYAYFSSFAVTWLEHARRYIRVRLRAPQTPFQPVNTEGFSLARALLDSRLRGNDGGRRFRLFFTSFPRRREPRTVQFDLNRTRMHAGLWT